MASDRIDFKRALDAYRATRGRFRLLQVPDMQYLMLDGHGDPNVSLDFAAAIQALYPVAYALKFASRRALGRDYVVPPLEGLWWADDMDAFTAARDKSRWHWTLMLMVPDWIDRARVAEAIERTAASKPDRPVDRVRLQTLSEGLCVQTLHVGAFDDEAELLARLHREFVPAQGLRLAGRHHEVYFSDFRRVAPERRRTLVRQPVVRAGAPDA